MRAPRNSAAELIVQAESVLTDLDVQIGELIAAKARQQATIEGLTQVAEWEEIPDPPTDPVEPEPTEDQSPAE